jgi:NDP-sugar pyrophosphorylase family protein
LDLSAEQFFHFTLPAGQPFDLAEVLGRLLRDQQLAGYEVKERFYEIGSPAGLVEMEKLFGG